MSDVEFFDSLCQRIRIEYAKLGHFYNWKFLYTPEQTLSPNQQLFFVGLNPGGGKEGDIFEEERCCREGNAYRCERWGEKYAPGKSPLQRQVQRLYQEIDSRLKVSVGYKRLMDESLGANYVPFRSPNWKALPKKRESLEFAYALWRDIFKFAMPRAIICISELPYRHFMKLLNEKQFKKYNTTSSHIGWGRVTYSMARLESADATVLLARLPHLSTYRIFSRRQCNRAIEKVTNEIASVLDKNAF